MLNLRDKPTINLRSFLRFSTLNDPIHHCYHSLIAQLPNTFSHTYRIRLPRLKTALGGHHVCPH